MSYFCRPYRISALSFQGVGNGPVNRMQLHQSTEFINEIIIERMNLRRGIEVENIWKISFAQEFLRVALVVRFKVLQRFHQNIDSIEYGPYRFEMASWRKLEFDVVQIWFSFRQILPQGCVKCAKQRRTTQTWTAQTVKHKTWSSFNCCSDNRLAQYMHRAPKVKRWIVCHIRCLHWKIEFICCDERNPDAKWKHVKYVFFLSSFPLSVSILAHILSRSFLRVNVYFCFWYPMKPLCQLSFVFDAHNVTIGKVPSHNKIERQQSSISDVI